MRILQDERGHLFDFCAVVALALLMVAALPGPARSHSWYDPDCCSDHDCEPVSAVSFVASDPKSVPIMVVTTSLGTKPVTPSTKIRQSKDGRMHACIYQERLLCLYLPPSN
jgi:hypothetical protein